MRKETPMQDEPITPPLDIGKMLGNAAAVAIVAMLLGFMFLPSIIHWTIALLRSWGAN